MNKMYSEKPFLTVVVPVYNVEKYLAECLDSLLNQTVMDHKVIVVNDGSKDSSGEIAKDYANKHPELIRYVEQVNKGLGAARNTGMALVDTEYVTFLDSDDWWDCMFVEKVKQEFARHEENPDIAFTLPWIFNDATRRTEEWHDKYQMELLFYPNGGDENSPSVVTNIREKHGMNLYSLEASSCRRIYRMSFLKKIGFSFAEGVKWEDVRPHFHAIHNAKSCIGIRSTGFFYRINTGGQITSGGGVSRLDIIPVFRETLQMAVDEGWDTEEIGYIIKMFWSFTLWSIEMTNEDYILPLLTGVHEFIKTIPEKYIRLFTRKHTPYFLRDMVIIKVLQSPFYTVLKDYRVRAKGIGFFRRVKQALKINRIIDKIRRRRHG